MGHGVRDDDLFDLEPIIVAVMNQQKGRKKAI